ncbi:hypothetical protein K502DRAFT_342894 [Neoconidiobolus thromboides FSU 785]|nr:hypothetical protein K502DRAFT_342894 [Neoconidiobolus thromboides FSU 785]
MIFYLVPCLAILKTILSIGTDVNLNYNQELDRHANTDGALFKQDTFNNGNTQSVLAESLGKGVGIAGNVQTPFNSGVNFNTNANVRVERFQVFNDDLGNFILNNKVRVYFDINGVEKFIDIDAGIPYLNLLTPF